MILKALKTSVFAFVFLLAVSCGESTEVVESGTYQGTVVEVEPEKTEIYVETEDNQTLELYFTEGTELTRNGSPVEFSALETGQKVEVVVERVGKRLDPVSVEIIE
ncbi:MAG TPA: hypothetical protein VFM60_00845 [Salinimicrobium sp.]|nr:hypothetical protein [Salinimicrobium sp.]